MNNTIIKDPNLEPFYISKDKYCYTVVELVTPTRTRGKSTKAKEPYEKSGLGLGTFLGKTLLERQGANLLFRKNADLGGALVNINWSPDAFNNV